MNLLFAASEVAPFIKTGGLADVAGSLPPALAGSGHDVRVILPLYEGIGQEWRNQMTFQKYFYVRLAWRSVYCGIFSLERDGVTYYFVDNEQYFKRGGLYGHYDDAERFAFFSRAVVEAPDQLGWHPDVIHCNDWQTALVPIYLLEERHQRPMLYNTKSVFTIHNIEYQGRYGQDLVDDLFGLDRTYLHEHMLAYHHDLNLMKGAIYAADYVTTVSPTYAEELKYPFYAHGLEGVISDNSHKLRGILNGIDTAAYNPASDHVIRASFTPDDLRGKAACKAALQQQLGLWESPDIPVVACVSRLVGHKGFELITSGFHRMMECNIQFVLLGTGEWGYEQFFRDMQNQYPGRVSANIMYSGSLSSAIYAGADLYLMPSISEPCGLSQMIAMRYGTIPVVRETGGLRDSVFPYNKFTGEGRGFTFAHINTDDMIHVLRQAVDLYTFEKKAWTAMMVRDMETDFSWSRSAESYLEVYSWITGLPAHPQPAEPEPEPALSAETPGPESPAAQEPETPVPAAEAPAPAEAAPAPGEETPPPAEAAEIPAPNPKRPARKPAEKKAPAPKASSAKRGTGRKS